MRKIAALLLALLLAFAMTAGIAEQKTPVVLETWIVQTDWSDAWDEFMKPKFEEEYPWITLEAVGLGEKNMDYIIAHIAAEDTPDVWQVDNLSTFYDAVDAGLLADLNTLEVSQHIPQAYRDAFTYNGKLFGLTQGAAFSTLYLNMKILEDAGWTKVPENWDEFIQCCEDIKTKTGIAPLTLAGDKTTTCWMLLELIIGNVAGDELGLGVYEEQFMAGTFDFLKYPKIAEHLAQIAPYMLTGTGAMTEEDVTAAMTDGIVAMCVAQLDANNIAGHRDRAGTRSTSRPARALRAARASGSRCPRRPRSACRRPRRPPRSSRPAKSSSTGCSSPRTSRSSRTRAAPCRCWIR